MISETIEELAGDMTLCFSETIMLGDKSTTRTATATVSRDCDAESVINMLKAHIQNRDSIAMP